MVLLKLENILSIKMNSTLKISDITAGYNLVELRASISFLPRRNPGTRVIPIDGTLELRFVSYKT